MPQTTRPRFAPHVAAAAVVALVAAGCATAPIGDATAPNPRDGQILTREDIARSGAQNGWEALRRGSTTLSIFGPVERPTGVIHRGVESFNLSPQVLLVLDGTHMASLSALQDVRAESIEYIQILPARVGVVKYGTAAGAGAVVVRTGAAPAS